MNRTRIGMMGAIAAVIAGGSAPSVGFGGSANPEVCAARRQRDADARLARKDRLTAKAEAKRARKRLKRRGIRNPSDALVQRIMREHDEALRYLAGGDR
jgi:hypothetical protein